MMNIKAMTLIIIASFINCELSDGNGKKIIDTYFFTIEVPSGWEYHKKDGYDSFVGDIKGEGVHLSFDLSGVGYASSLIPDEREFVYERKHEWMPMDNPYQKKRVIYTSARDLDKEKARIMKRRGITDSSLVKVERIQIPKEEIIYKDGKYSAILSYRDTSIQLDIDIPEETKNYNFQIDTIGPYKRKIISPKNPEKGLTGIYLKDINSHFDFNLYGRDLSLENQNLAVQAFKTIKFKKEKELSIFNLIVSDSAQPITDFK